jgi:EAL domain-containing protein (putative c-di-GMP-specific phosphodiesterase class I)
MLARAIAERHVTAAYQPKLSCRDGALAGFECLARWIDPELGTIMPDRFIGLAEKAGLIGPLTLAVTRQSLDWLADVFPGGGATMAINISPAALEVPTLPAEITGECARRGIEPRRVVLEITETITMQDPLRMLELLTQFRLRGFQLAVDDFGVGYSSFTALARLPFSEIKIDKSFTMAAEASADARKIVAAIVGVGRALGLTVTAEGVETPWAMRFLEELGCDQVQGYLIARPMDGARARAWALQRAAPGASAARP